MNLGGTVLVIFASSVFSVSASACLALDGNDVFAKLNAVTSINGLKIAAEGISVDGDNVTLKHVALTIVAMNKTFSLGDMKLEGVGERDGGYTIEKASIADLDVTKDGTGFKARNIYLAGISVPAVIKLGALETSAWNKSVHIGPIEYVVQNKDAIMASLVTGEGEISANKSRIDTSIDVTGIKFDGTAIPDLKAQEMIRMLGLLNTNGDIGLKVAWTLASGKMDIDIALNFDAIGKIDLKSSLSGYTLAEAAKHRQDYLAKAAIPDQAARKAAMHKTTVEFYQQRVLNNASIRFDDAGITAKALDYAGKKKGIDGKQLAKSLKSMLPLVIGRLPMPDIKQQILTAVDAYLDAPKNIEISANPAKPLPISQFVEIAKHDPANFGKTLNLKVIANQ